MTQTGFFRIEGYGLEARWQAGKKTMPWRTIAGVAAEAARKVGAASHVKGNVAIELLLGEDPMTLAEFAVDQARRAMNQGHVKPGRLSSTASSFFGAVASFPESSRERAEDPSFIERFMEWRERLLNWIQARWGQFRVSVVEHRDEEFWHIHILIVPPVDCQNRLLVGLVHPGYAARGDLEREGRSSIVANAAYNTAMKTFLDEYQREVGAPSGHTRQSKAPRKRVTRQQVLIDRQQRERTLELREEERALILASDSLQKQAASLEVQIAAAAKAEHGFAAELANLERQRQQLDRERGALRATSTAEHARQEAAWVRKRSRLGEAVELVRAESERNAAEHQRLVGVRRQVMTSDAAQIADENAQLRASLAEAQRRLAAYEAEREVQDPSAPRLSGTI